MRKLTLAAATMNQTPMDWGNNMGNILTAIAEAQSSGIELLLLPELTITGYGCEDLFLSQWLPEKAMALLDQVREACDDITVSVGLPVLFQDQLFNCAAVIQNQQIIGLSAKQNLANEGIHYEHRWFTPWPRHTTAHIDINGVSVPIGDITYDINEVKIGFEICEDAWTDDRPACRLKERGVELILNPSASHFAFGKSKTRQELIVNSSKTFDCVYVYTNLLGNEAGRVIYDGEIIFAQKGKLIAENTRLSYHDIDIVGIDIDFDAHKNEVIVAAQTTKEQEFSDAATLGLFDYLRKSRSKGFVLSLSGGADSSTCAALVSLMITNGIEALGTEEFLTKIGREDLMDSSVEAITAAMITCAYQGSKQSGKATFNAAQSLANSIGATFHHWSIDSEVADYSSAVEKALGRSLTWDTDDIALQNIQARSRSPIIWMLANINKALLLTTSNRSEGDVGYTTMDGDTSGSIAPIAGVDKPFIRHWLKWAEHNLNLPGLQQVNALAPTAELRPSSYTQTDEDDLMPYDTMLAIEKLAIGERKSPIEVFQLLNSGDNPQLKLHIVKFFRLWSQNQWKRERIAPAFHLDDFNVDPKTWCRFPILSGGYHEELEALKDL